MGYEVSYRGQTAMVVDPGQSGAKWRVHALGAQFPTTHFGDDLDSALGLWKQAVDEIAVQQEGQIMPSDTTRHSTPGFVQVDLLTRFGGWVTRVEIPLMEPPPEVIAWGERLFVRQIVGGAGWRYIEGMLWVVPVSVADEEELGDGRTI